MACAAVVPSSFLYHQQFGAHRREHLPKSRSPCCFASRITELHSIPFVSRHPVCQTPVLLTWRSGEAVQRAARPDPSRPPRIPAVEPPGSAHDGDLQMADRHTRTLRNEAILRVVVVTRGGTRICEGATGGAPSRGSQGSGAGDERTVRADCHGDQAPPGFRRAGRIKTKKDSPARLVARPPAITDRSSDARTGPRRRRHRTVWMLAWAAWQWSGSAGRESRRQGRASSPTPDRTRSLARLTAERHERVRACTMMWREQRGQREKTKARARLGRRSYFDCTGRNTSRDAFLTLCLLRVGHTSRRGRGLHEPGLPGSPTGSFGGAERKRGSRTAGRYDHGDPHRPTTSPRNLYRDRISRKAGGLADRDRTDTRDHPPPRPRRSKLEFGGARRAEPCAGRRRQLPDDRQRGAEIMRDSRSEGRWTNRGGSPGLWTSDDAQRRC